ncbi:hypothetical protein PVAG01_00098 [Phlyctema vagabunda]|uniref:Rad21/Rec8-like protein N-terminal domain-containing protein n=1 Tax=Phlyctema vagabunda TaxID=108571 RepID=A0ABR4PTB0_9HELO
MSVLTNRKYGVATVWLVATLGAKSNARKVTRKAILDVNVQKACETIIQPEAPMALRLQSNLLYGVSRVYSQQVGYVLADAQAAQTMMRAMVKIAWNHEIDLEAGRAHPEQLILMDDPAFLADMALPPLEFALSRFNFAPTGDSQASMMTPTRERSSNPSFRSASMPSINLPSSSNGGPGSNMLPLNDPFGNMSGLKTPSRKGGLFDNEEEIMLEDNLYFDIDSEGNLRDIADEERQLRRAASVIQLGRLGSDSAASGRVRQEHEDALNVQGNIMDEQGEFDMNQFGNEAVVLPDADPFPLMSGANPDASQRDPAEDPFSDPLVSSESAAAPQKRRRAKKAKAVLIDKQLSLPNAVLATWQRDYLDNMREVTSAKRRHHLVLESKEVADHFIWGRGIGHVGDGVGSSRIPGPLAAIFTGEALMKRIIGGKTLSTKKAKKSAKRAHEADSSDEADSGTRRVRARQEDEEAARAFLDDGNVVMMMGDDSVSIEVGREAQPDLPDVPSSAMPWNVSASLHSRQLGHSQPSSSIRGPGSYLAGSLGRRHTAASPLSGRGLNLPGELENFSQLHSDEDAPIMYGRSEEDNDDVLRGLGSQPGSMSEAQANDFELYGAAANVDTQEAAKSQWVRNALDQESNNFLDYVRNSIQEKRQQHKDDGGGDADDEVNQQPDNADPDDVFGAEAPNANTQGKRWVSFEELFDPDTHSRIVAAQAFYHVLTLATRHRVWADQHNTEQDTFADIRIGIVGAA